MMSRDSFIEYVYDLKPDAERMAGQPFNNQALTMMDELDSFRAGFGSE